MRITETIKVMKQINPDKVMLLKVGRFYYQYGKDAYILAYANGDGEKWQSICQWGRRKVAINKNN